MTKREIVVELLRRYRDAECTLLKSSAGGNDNPIRMPKAWNASFRELERCLQVLSGERPKQARQLMARYVDPTISRRKLVGRRNNRGEVIFLKLPAHCEVRSYAQLPERGHAHEWDVILASWPTWVRESSVKSALDEIERISGSFEFYLPAEMFEAVAA